MNKFYHFHQNNSGGSFDKDENVNVHTIIEAADADEANRIAEAVGIYFNGVEFNEDGENIGRDCECCGDRWNRVSEYDATETPCRYGEPVDGSEEDVVIHRKWVAPKALKERWGF